jgi:hypothetical protein
MKKLLCCVLSFAILSGQVFAQSEEPISELQAMQQESAQAATQQEFDEDAYDNNSNPQQRFEENPQYNVHNYSYKQQVIVGGSVMFCIILAMVANNNYNPKSGAKK